MTPPRRVTGVILCYNRPDFVRRVLHAHARQTRPVDEVVITDDGSTMDIPAALADLLPTLPFPVTYVGQPHRGFRAAKCRNNGIRVATGEYLLFADQDIVFLPTYVATFLAHARPREFLVGYPVRLDEGTTQRVTEQMVREGALEALVSPAAAAKVGRQRRKEELYRLLHRLGLRRIGPKLRSGVFGGWRADLLEVNGFDEEYQGWGNEDDDLGARLHRAGIRGRNVFGAPLTLHLWHPPHAAPGVRSNDPHHDARQAAVARGAVRARHGVADPLGGDESHVTPLPARAAE